ncbi:MAG: SGNH/GDSL hydrolase family protein [Myxococcota bacterium]|nr:SGNH/GDSL hydrolase family protein [Myxococcota bacterium]
MKRNLALLGVVVLLCLLGGELLLRAWGFGRTVQYEYDESLLWRFVPDQDAYAPSYRVGYRINSRGHRGPEVAVPKPPGVFRVLGIGDSVLFGQGVPDEQTLVRRLEAALRARWRTSEVEVINAGVPGHAVQQYEVFLRSEGLGLEPDLVLVGFCKNDVVSAEQVAEMRVYAERFRPRGARVVRDRIRRASAWLHVGVGLYDRVASLWRPLPRGLAYEGGGVTQASWAFTLDRLEAMARLTRERDIPLLLAVFPKRVEIEEGGIRVPIDPILALGPRPGFHVADLHEAFLGSEQPLFLDPVHPTAAGNERAAEAVLAYLDASRLLDRPMDGG